MSGAVTVPRTRHVSCVFPDVWGFACGGRTGRRRARQVGGGAGVSESEGQCVLCPGSWRARLPGLTRRVTGGGVSSAVSQRSAAPGPRAAIGRASSQASGAPSELRWASGASGDRRRLVLHGPVHRNDSAADARPTLQSVSGSVHAGHAGRPVAYTHAETCP